MTDKTPLPNQNDRLFENISLIKRMSPWKILLYGLQRNLINETFIVNFALYYLENSIRTKDDLAIELAGLLKNEHHKASIILSEKLKTQLSFKEKIDLNKIWFYISISSELILDDLL